MESRYFKEVASFRYLSTLLVLWYFILNCAAVEDDVLFTVTRAPRYLGILQDHRGEPLSVEPSAEYMDQDYIATNRKRHKMNWDKNPLDVDDFEDEDTEEEDKDRDVRGRGRGGNRLPGAPV
ncbi:uncharacterized protein LOC121732459 [Aricia agestis]|uniref:uncharacterized protein LOC121732459 n=1 Tax=Aricia agestis TaxID=91739 RepID=UPI001C205C49|nr:uncharacterized protein LOC121732459 [Aricia agestis]